MLPTFPLSYLEKTEGGRKGSVKRRRFLQAGAATALGGPFLAAPAIAQSAPEIKWRMASSFSKSVETIYGTAQTLCRYIAEATDNKFQIQAHTAGELAASRQALDAVSSGAIECAHTPLFFMPARTPPSVLPAAFPSASTPGSRCRGGRSVAEPRSSTPRSRNSMRTASRPAARARRWVPGSRRRSTRSRTSRASGSASARWVGRSWPGSACCRSDLAHADVYAALENGTIDAAEFICPHDDEKLGLVRVAKFNHYPCWWESGGMVHMVVNLDKWSALPKSYQAIVARACEAANAWMLAKYDAVNPPALGASSPPARC